MFQADYLELSEHEIIEFLLKESGQTRRDAINPAEMVEYLKLQHLTIDFNRHLPIEEFKILEKPRALLSFHDRLIATDMDLEDHRARFSVLHEIAHYVLPTHEYGLYLCDEECLNFMTHIQCEKQANAFAAKVLFHGDRFALEANTCRLSAQAVKDFAGKYKVSFEATARQMVEQNLRPCMLVVFEEVKGDERIDLDYISQWKVKYSIPSNRFKKKYFLNLQGSLSTEISSALTGVSRDIADSLERKINIPSAKGEQRKFRAEFFYNSYNILGFLEPLT